MKLKDQSLEHILKSYDFPKRFLVYFASQCAKDALGRAKDPDPRSVKAVEVAERYGNGEHFEEAYLREVHGDADAAWSATVTATTAAATATSATYAAAATSATYAATYAATSAAYAAAATTAYANYATTATYAADYYKPLLFKLINERLTRIEKLLIFGEEKV